MTTGSSGSSGGQAAPSPAPAPPAQSGSAPSQPIERLVIEGQLGLRVDDIDQTMATLRAKVGELRGSLVREQLGGGASSRNANIRIRVPPAAVEDFVAWLGQQGEVTHQFIERTDVSRQFIDQAIALENLQLTLDRTRALLQREDLDIQQVLVIEGELTRLRGRIEQIKGEQRWLENRVAQATLNVNLRSETEVFLRPSAKFYPGPRLTGLYFLDREDGPKGRLGGGAALYFTPQTSVELDVFAGRDGGSSGLLTTIGGSVYSDFLGRGRRRFFNPHLGMRLGFAHFDAPSFAFGAGAGVELFKHEYLMIDTNVRVMGLLGSDGVDTALLGNLSAIVAF